MSISIGICDDNAEDTELLKEALYAYDQSFDIISYTDGQALIDDILNEERKLDILFLDIYMPGTGGIETAERIRRKRMSR